MTQTVLPPAPRRDPGDVPPIAAGGHLRVVNDLVARIGALHQRLATAPSLRPGPTVDATFGELVNLAVRAVPGDVADAVLGHRSIRPLLPELRRISSAGEAALESHWAARLIAGAATGVGDFPYYDNYHRLTRLEYQAALGAGGRTPTRIAFVGSGPLPLTSILLGTVWGADVVNLDLDPAAHEQARALVARLGLPPMGFRDTDVLDHHDFTGYDTVWLAALVGTTPEGKARVMAHLFDRVDPGTVVVARSAHGLRRLLYPEVVAHDLGGFQPLAVIHPHTDIVNSVVLAQKPETR